MKRKEVLIIASILLIFAIGYFSLEKILDHFYDDNIPILAYHEISDHPKSDMEVTPENFEKQMKFLYNHNFKVMNLDEVEDFKKHKERFKGKKVAITFDDGKESYYTKAVPILEKYHFQSTLFVITDRIDDKSYITKEQFEELKKNKLVFLESHSYKLHDHDSAKSNDYELYDKDLKKNKDYQFKYYAYPYGISNENYIKALKDNDIHMAFKYSPSHWMNTESDNYTLPRVPVYNSTSYLKFILKVLIKR